MTEYRFSNQFSYTLKGTHEYDFAFQGVHNWDVLFYHSVKVENEELVLWTGDNELLDDNWLDLEGWEDPWGREERDRFYFVGTDSKVTSKVDFKIPEGELDAEEDTEEHAQVLLTEYRKVAAFADLNPNLTLSDLRKFVEDNCTRIRFVDSEAPDVPANRGFWIDKVLEVQYGGERVDDSHGVIKVEDNEGEIQVINLHEKIGLAQ